MKRLFVSVFVILGTILFIPSILSFIVVDTAYNENFYIKSIEKADILMTIVESKSKGTSDKIAGKNDREINIVFSKINKIIKRNILEGQLKFLITDIYNFIEGGEKPSFKISLAKTKIEIIEYLNSIRKEQVENSNLYDSVELNVRLFSNVVDLDLLLKLSIKLKKLQVYNSWFKFLRKFRFIFLIIPVFFLLLAVAVSGSFKTIKISILINFIFVITITVIFRFLFLNFLIYSNFFYQFYSQAISLLPNKVISEKVVMNLLKYFSSIISGRLFITSLILIVSYFLISVVKRNKPNTENEG